MFGYTVPMYQRLSPSANASYRKYYCETCHQLKDGFGIVSTMAVNYDMTFNTIAMNSFTDAVEELDVTKTSVMCVFGKPSARSELFKRMAAYTVLLTKWELYDDHVDKGSMKSTMASVALGRAISKAESVYPAYDETVGKGFERLREMEEAECTDVSKMGRTFGIALAEPLKDIAGIDDVNMDEMFINLTSVVYLMDAIDDLDDDYMDDTYNPLLVGRDFVNKGRFINDNMYELTEMLNRSIGDLQYSYSMARREMTMDTDIMDNIVYYGIPQSARSVMACNCSARPSLKNACDSRARRVSG